MEVKINAEIEENPLEAKQNTIQDVKAQFNKIIKKKLGALLISGLSESLGIEILDHDQIKIFKLPLFLKPIFTYFKDSQLLIETSLLYIMHCLELMNNEMHTNYDMNLVKIEQNKRDIIGLKDLLWVNLDPSMDFVCKFILPTYLLRIYPALEKEFPNLITFGALKIFEWLNLLNEKSRAFISQYEGIFQQVYLVIHSSDRNR
ncbi:MAG: hypothetical protein EU536_01805 [Promethearchaeota archaeon]|nr:MAG: hypothetical protein EU536_01805 [Candidatus Lokiarchaeota archaeon]